MNTIFRFLYKIICNEQYTYFKSSVPPFLNTKMIEMKCIQLCIHNVVVITYVILPLAEVVQIILFTFALQRLCFVARYFQHL